MSIYTKSDKGCTDYPCPTVDDISHYFDNHPYRIHRKESAVYALGTKIISRLGHADILSSSISEKNLKYFLVETVFFLARRLAVYTVLPQQYGYQPRNMLATSINAFSGRIYRFRSGHGLATKTRRQITKQELSDLIDELLDDGYIWLLCERLLKSYELRVKNGTCDRM